MNNKFIIIDGNSIANRAFYALPLLSNANGLHTNAVFGFTTMLLKVIEEMKPTHLLVAFDAGKIVFRHQEYKDYKGGRQKTPGELSEQFPYIRELLDAFDIRHFELEGYEADDIIGTMTKQAEQRKISAVIVTGDKDMLQLVSPNVHVALTRKGISEIEWYTPESIQEKYGLVPAQIIDLKGLMGDASDNIPGIPGVGEKTALKLLHEFGSVENVLEHVEQVSGKKLQEKIRENREDAIKSKELATILRSAPIEIEIEETVYHGFKEEKIYNTFKKFEFKSLYDRVCVPQELQQEVEELEYTTVTEDNCNQFEQFLLNGCALHVELKGDNYHRAEIVGFGVESNGNCFYIPFEVLSQWPSFTHWLENENDKIIYDLKRAMVALRWHQVELKGVRDDVMLASYLVNPTETDFGLSEVARRACGFVLATDDHVYGKGTKSLTIDPGLAAEHVSRKALAIKKSWDSLQEQLKERDMESLFHDLEMPLAAVLVDMEFTGIGVDSQKLQKMGEELEIKLSFLTKEIYQLAGEEFNINSPKQLGEILFDKLGLPPLKKTKTGYSTNAEVLEKLQGMHEIIPRILHFRQLGKLHSTYIEGLMKEINPKTGKIHTSYNQATTATGRLSSTEPNLQNIPIRLEEGRKIREAFVPSQENWLILSADYSQIELRVLAHIAGDENLKEAFHMNADIHTKTAMDVFGVPREQVTSDMRRQAKAVNFGIVYGISDYGLSQNLNITRKEAAQFIDRYFSVFQGVKQYMEDIVKKARRDSFVTTLLHRRRYLPEINHSNFNIRSFAERTAMNTPIQGTAADIIKLAMVDMGRVLKEKNMKSRMLLQVHDELLFEVSADELEEMMNIVSEVMENALALDVPLKVDVHYGPTWYEAK
ncbi:MAG TPA: DNA polymerase I [Bacillota bacterium]|nr:DNA polymerase I [Bacillota bacterium]